MPRPCTALSAPAQPPSATFDADRREALRSFLTLSRSGVSRETLCGEIESTACAMRALVDLQASAT